MDCLPTTLIPVLSMLGVHEALEAMEDNKIKDHSLRQWYFKQLEVYGQWNGMYGEESNWPNIGCKARFVAYAKGA